MSELESKSTSVSVSLCVNVNVNESIKKCGMQVSRSYPSPSETGSPSDECCRC